MRIFIATLGTETNTFSPLPTGRQTFEETLCLREASRHSTHFAAVPVVTWRRLGEADGHTIVESLSAFAQPGGPTVRTVYEGLRDEILGDLQAAHPVDAVLLFLHGAMVAEGYDDCEGDVIRRCRAIVGPRVPIGVELDLHCHITPAMVEHATAIVTFKEYPHVDVGDRAADLYRLVAAAARGAVRPVSALYDCRMVGMFRTPVAPVRGFVDRLKAVRGPRRRAGGLVRPRLSLGRRRGRRGPDPRRHRRRPGAGGPARRGARPGDLRAPGPDGDART